MRVFNLDTTTAGLASLLSLRTAGAAAAAAAMDLTTAYRYNQNMMEYYTCKGFSMFLCLCASDEGSDGG